MPHSGRHKVQAPTPMDEFAKFFEEGMETYYDARYKEYKRQGYSDEDRDKQQLGSFGNV